VTKGANASMDLEQVVKLLDLMESHGLDEVEIEQGGVRIRLKKGGTAMVATPMIAAPMPVAAINNMGHGAVANEAEAVAEETAVDDTVEVKSPMVGTFYRAAAPDADPFAHEGDKVTPDAVVCIIEAMKVMNEIRAEVEGEIIKFLVESGESVEYGQPIMLVRKPAATE